MNHITAQSDIRTVLKDPDLFRQAALIDGQWIHRPDIEGKLLRAEYKRRQAPPGVKIGSRNFGRDRRCPITNFFHTRPAK